MYEDLIFHASVSAYAGLYDGLVESLTKRLLGLDTESAIDEAFRILDAWRDVYANIMTSTIIASELAGAVDVASMVPPDRAPPDRPYPSETFWDDPLEFPVIDAAARNLWSRRLMLKSDFDQLGRQAREQAFTVANVYGDGALSQIRKSLAEAATTGETRQDWGDRLPAALKSAFLSPRHQEVVYRTNLMTALARGQEAVATSSAVADLFPYVENLLIRDHRQTELCQAISESGIGGSAIFRVDDPAWQKFKAPRHFNCRCTANFITLDMAAAKGIDEAKEWMATGKPPESPFWVREPVWPSWAQEHNPGSMVELPKGWG